MISAERRTLLQVEAFCSFSLLVVVIFNVIHVYHQNFKFPTEYLSLGLSFILIWNIISPGADDRALGVGVSIGGVGGGVGSGVGGDSGKIFR